MKLVPLVLASVLVAPVVAHGQSLRELSRTRPVTQSQMHPGPIDRDREHEERDDLNAATWVYVAAASADWTATAVCERALCGERTMTGLVLYGVEDSRVAIPIGLAIDALFIYGVREIVAPDHPKLARGLLYGASAVRLVFTVNKVNDLRDRFPVRP